MGQEDWARDDYNTGEQQDRVDNSDDRGAGYGIQSGSVEDTRSSDEAANPSSGGGSGSSTGR